MKTGHHSRLTTGIIDYKQLRKVNPETARLAVLEYLKTNHHNVSDAARVFSINRCVVYDIIHKEREGDLKDRPRTPKRQPSKTPSQIEDKVIEVKNQTGYGPKRLSRHLEKHHQLKVPYGTIRHILRRNKERVKHKVRYVRRKKKREFVDWYSAKPFEIVQMDIKFIRFETKRP